MEEKCTRGKGQKKFNIISHRVVVTTKDTIIMPRRSPAFPGKVFLHTDINKCMDIKLYSHPPSEQSRMNPSITHLLQSYLEYVIVTM